MSWIMLIVLFSFVTSMFISLVSNPMTMVIMIIFQSLLICMMIYMFMSVSWYSYILFLIFMGGLMVVFIYICSIASNEMFLSSTKMWMIFSFFVVSVVLSSMSNCANMNVLDLGKVSVVFKMMESNNSMLIILTMFFLLFSLVVVVKISNMKMGPVRAIKK